MGRHPRVCRIWDGYVGCNSDGYASLDYCAIFNRELTQVTLYVCYGLAKTEKHQLNNVSPLLGNSIGRVDDALRAPLEDAPQPP